MYWVNYKGASTLSTQLMKRDGETCCRLAFSTRLPCTLDMPNKASDMSRARCCHGGVELPVLWHACPSGDQTIYQARIPHTSFSSGDMIRWQVRVRLGQRVSGLGCPYIAGKAIVSRSVAGLISVGHARVLSPIYQQVKSTDGAESIFPPPLRERPNASSADEDGSLHRHRGGSPSCGTVAGPPAGADSPGVPVLEW